MANGEDRILFVKEYTPSQFSDIDPDNIYCLDLNYFSYEDAQDWIDRTQRLYYKHSPSIVPCIVVMGTPERLERDGRAFTDAGAVLWEKPSEFDSESEWAKKNILMREFSLGREEPPTEQEEGKQDGREGDWLSAEHFDEPTDGNQQSAAGSVNDSSIYVSPPYELDAQDFERLMQRMRMPDDDPTKDD